MNHLVIDASVFISGSQTGEADHPSCLQFLSRIRQVAGVRVTCPTLVIPECAGAIARITGEQRLAERIVSIVEDCPGLRLLDLDAEFAEVARSVAVSCRLRGSDAVYVAVAKRINGLLITLDREVLTRGVAVASISSPMQWIAGTRLPG